MLQHTLIEGSEPAKLLRSVAEQLRLPLSAIARQAELGELMKDGERMDNTPIWLHAQAALNLVDCYLLGLQLIQEQTALTLEPVSVPSAFTDIAHELSGFAKQYEIRLQLHLAGRYEPIMAHKTGLKAAFLSLAYELLQSGPLAGNDLTLGLHRTRRGIVAGLYGHYQQQFSPKQWHQALRLQGRATQPLHTIATGPAAGLFVANTILQAMGSQLRPGRYARQRGLTMVFQPSHQLQLV